MFERHWRWFISNRTPHRLPPKRWTISAALSATSSSLRVIHRTPLFSIDSSLIDKNKKFDIFVCAIIEKMLKSNCMEAENRLRNKFSDCSLAMLKADWEEIIFISFACIEIAASPKRERECVALLCVQKRFDVTFSFLLSCRLPVALGKPVTGFFWGKKFAINFFLNLWFFRGPRAWRRILRVLDGSRGAWEAAGSAD